MTQLHVKKIISGARFKCRMYTAATFLLGINEGVLVCAHLCTRLDRADASISLSRNKIYYSLHIEYNGILIISSYQFTGCLSLKKGVNGQVSRAQANL